MRTRPAPTTVVSNRRPDSILTLTRLPTGAFRVRANGSAGGHNGLKSIEAALQSQAYARLRIGVGPLPEGVSDWSEYVLAPFDPEQVQQLETLEPELIAAVEQWLRA